MRAQIGVEAYVLQSEIADVVVICANSPVANALPFPTLKVGLDDFEQKLRCGLQVRSSRILSEVAKLKLGSQSFAIVG